MTMKKYGFLAIALALLAALAFWALAPKTAQNETVKIGYLAIGAGLPLFVAEQEGYFSQRGIEVELIEFRSSNDVASAAIAGRIDVVGTGATNAMLDANLQTNAGFRLFLANNYVKRPDGQSTDFVLVSSSSNVSTFADLEGETIAIFPGSVGEVFAEAVVPKLGLSIDDVDLVSMAPPQWMPALKSGNVSAILGAVEPFATQMLAEGAGRILVDGYYAELMPSVPASGAWFVEGRLDRGTEEQVFSAFEDAIEFIDQNEAVARSALAGYTSISESLLSEIRLQDWTMLDDAGTRQAALEFAEIFARTGGIQEAPGDDSWLWE